VCGQPQADAKTVELWVRDHEGALAMSATAVVA
jgi:3-methylfumaryl-CoA hydratase